LEIRSMYNGGKRNGGMSCSEIGKQFSVSKECIESVIKRKSWKHI
jgi:transposase